MFIKGVPFAHSAILFACYMHISNALYWFTIINYIVGLMMNDHTKKNIFYTIVLPYIYYLFTLRGVLLELLHEEQ